MADKKKHSKTSDILSHVGVIAILILLNYVLSFSFGRFDLTEDKRHSLSDNTIELLQDEGRIEDRIFFKIYLDGDLPADIRKIRNAIEEKLDEFIIYAGDMIQYEFIDPNGEEDEDYNLQMQKVIYGEGIVPCDIEIVKSGKAEIKTIWPGALIEYKGTTVDRVQFFDKKVIYSGENIRGLADRTINNLEYQLISAIRRVTADDKMTVSFLQGQGELKPHQTMDVRNGLNRYYLVNDVEINGQLNALDETNALIVAQPTKAFNEKDKFIIDQFIMNGGRVLWFIDPLNVSRDSLYRTGQTFGMTANLNIEKDMIYKYGARLNTNLIIDSDCGPIFIPGHPLGIVDWYFYPLLQREFHPITKNIDPIKAEYASSIDIVNESDKDVSKTVLLRSSYNSLMFKSPARINYSIIDVEPNFNDGESGDYPVAVMLEGKFTSAFENRGISETFLNSPDFATKFKSDSTKMLVVSDGDIIRNEVVDSAFVNGQWRYRFVPIGSDMFSVQNPNGTPKYAYGNKDFVLNAVDYMLDDFSLIDIRTKTITLRVLDTEKVNENKDYWKTLNIAFPLFVIMLLAVAQLLIRKRKYARTL
ncbi:MAG: gliding motility-associated ABC transporter substrate-binding protein GldG [Crocinitomicaceae bacterium]